MQKYKVTLSATAKNELQEIYDYIASATSDSVFSDSFIVKLRYYIESLRYFPERFPIYRGNIRRAVYPQNTNYVIFFKIDKNSSEVIVLDAVNTKQYGRYKNLGS